MRKILCFVGCACLLAGCGGGGNDRIPSPFRGSYSGTVFVDGDAGENMRLTIASDGTISGSETVGAATAADTGFVDNNGRIDITSRLAGTSDLFYSGTVGYNFNGHLVGSGTARQGGNSTSFSFNLTPTSF